MILFSIIILEGCAAKNAAKDGDNCIGDSCVGYSFTVPENPFIKGTELLKFYMPLRCQEVDFSNPSKFFIQYEQKDADFYAIYIFDAPIPQPESSNIPESSRKHIIWSWNSSLEKGVTGNVRYTDGNGVDTDGLPDRDKDPPDLSTIKDGIYFVLILGWSGIDLKYSSELRGFCVNSCPDTFQDMDVICAPVSP